MSPTGWKITGTWQPDNEGIAQQIRLLHRICLSRSEWRHHHHVSLKGIAGLPLLCLAKR